MNLYFAHTIRKSMKGEFTMLEKETETLPDKEYDYLKTASSQDCTGLIPAAPASNAELESYEDLYPFLPQAVASYKDTANKNS